METQTQTTTPKSNGKATEVAPNPVNSELLAAKTPQELYMATVKAVALKSPEKGAELAFGFLIYSDFKEFANTFVALAQQAQAQDSHRADARLELETREAEARIAVDNERTAEIAARRSEIESRVQNEANESAARVAESEARAARWTSRSEEEEG